VLKVAPVKRDVAIAILANAPADRTELRSEILVSKTRVVSEEAEAHKGRYTSSASARTRAIK
jgi:hypothetical protein